MENEIGNRGIRACLLQSHRWGIRRYKVGATKL